MSLEIRPYREDEADAFNRVPGIVFGNYRGDSSAETGRDLAAVVTDMGIGPDWSLCAFEDGVLATTYAAYPLVMRLNGAKAPVAGVTVVGTLPWFRRRGHLRKIMQADFERRYEQRLEPIAALLASIAAIYQRYGYAICSTSVRYDIDPRWVNFAPSLPPSRGTWREGKADELPLLQRIYRDFTKARNGYLHRAPVIWDGQVLGRGDSQLNPNVFGPSLVSVYEEGGEPQAYVAFAARFLEDSPIDHAGPGQRLVVRDYVWKTPDAYRAIWDLLKTFDLANRIWVQAAPVDDPAPYLLLDPRELHATHRDHLMGRIIDVERALAQRPYGAPGRVVFDVRDEMCPWNAGRWSMETGAEGTRVSRTKESPQLSLDVSTLAQLLFGHLVPSRAISFGRAEAAPAAPLALWDAIWRTEYAPFCPDSF